MKIPVLGFLFWLLGLAVQAQVITFSEHIAPIVHKNCTPCHRQGEAAPFELISYEDVAKRGKFIQKVTESRYMPPWRADRGFGEFKHERRLSIGEIMTIKQWVANGMPQGSKVTDLSLVNGLQKGALLPQKPDLTLSMHKAHRIAGNNQESYLFFSMPTHLPENQLVKAIEFRAGNRTLAHHARVSIDTTHLMRAVDGFSIDDPAIAHLSKVKLMEDFWYGWIPGNQPFMFPKGTAKVLPKNSDLLLNLHYAPSPVADTDSSVVNIYFAKDTIDREVKTYILDESTISNQPFIIPQDSVSTFYAHSVPIPYDISLISIQPHMHVLGRSIRSYAITPEGDLIPLLQISNWDFDWQMTYEFKNLLKIPKGSVLYAEATYDNTAANPLNPNSPTKAVGYGWSTKTEMMNVIFHFVSWRDGD